MYHRGTTSLTEKMSGTHIFAGDCIPDEVSPATIPQRHVAGDRFLQRHVAGERPDISLGKDPIVVVERKIVSIKRAFDDYTLRKKRFTVFTKFSGRSCKETSKSEGTAVAVDIGSSC
ncbi:hypothetical protein Tco_1437072 [Tanacetum coccineum]